jgi:hypothetical protein
VWIEIEEVMAVAYAASPKMGHTGFNILYATNIHTVTLYSRVLCRGLWVHASFSNQKPDSLRVSLV